MDVGWLEAPGDVRFVVDGRRLPVAAGLELVAAGLAAVLIRVVEQLGSQKAAP